MECNQSGRQGTDVASARIQRNAAAGDQRYHHNISTIAMLHRATEISFVLYFTHVTTGVFKSHSSPVNLKITFLIEN